VRYEEETFAGDVILDDHEYVSCKFADGCTLHYSGGVITLRGNCKIFNVELRFHGAANRTIVWLKALSKEVPGGMAAIFALINAQPSDPGVRTN
jgi:hypothetical protein